jgi:hypothetical protein
VYFWDFVWLEDGVGDATEGSADVESEDERTLIAAVRFPSLGRDSHQGQLRVSVTEGKGEGDRRRVGGKAGMRQIIPLSSLRHWLLPPLWLAASHGWCAHSLFFHIATLPAPQKASSIDRLCACPPFRPSPFPSIAMMPFKANIRVQVPKGTTVELFALKKPFTSLLSSDRSTPTLENAPSRAHSLPAHPSQSDKLARGRAAARKRRGDQSSPSVSTERCSPNDKSNHSPQSSRVEPSNAIFASIRSELDATRSELERYRSDATKLGGKYRALERELEVANEALRSRDKQIEDLKRERDFAMADRKSRRSIRDLDRRPLRFDARRSSSTRSPSSRTACDSDHDHELDDLASLKSVGSYRGRRNKSLPPAPRAVKATYNDEPLPPPGGEVFLNKTDSWSGAQVIQAVQDLNSEILQLSAGATESVTIQGRDKTSQARMNQATKGVSSRLGVPFARLLASRDHTEEPALLQFGLQACVATCVSRLLGVFCVGLPLNTNDLFLQIHTHMHATGQPF